MIETNHAIISASSSASPTRRARIVIALAVASVGVALGAAFVVGARMRAAAEIQVAQTIEQENIAVCRKFGADPETSVYAACVEELGDVRRRHQERLQAEALGLL